MTLEFENELGEIRTVQSTQFRPRPRWIQPLVTGNLAPFFSLSGAVNAWKASVFGQKTAERTTSILDLVNTRPLVVSFIALAGVITPGLIWNRSLG